MPAGLQVWDASGNLIFDTPDRMGRIIGEYSTGTSAGSLVVPAPAGTTVFWFVSRGLPTNATSLSVSGSTITWAAGGAINFYYGYF